MTLDEMTDDAIDYIFDNLQWDELDQWETGFCESCHSRWERYRELSDRQKEVLGAIWDKQS